MRRATSPCSHGASLARPRRRAICASASGLHRAQRSGRRVVGHGGKYIEPMRTASWRASGHRWVAVAAAGPVRGVPQLGRAGSLRPLAWRALRPSWRAARAAACAWPCRWRPAAPASTSRRPSTLHRRLRLRVPVGPPDRGLQVQRARGAGGTAGAAPGARHPAARWRAAGAGAAGAAGAAAGWPSAATTRPGSWRGAWPAALSCRRRCTAASGPSRARTRPQLTLAQRRVNLRGAFMVNPSRRAPLQRSACRAGRRCHDQRRHAARSRHWRCAVPAPHGSMPGCWRARRRLRTEDRCVHVQHRARASGDSAEHRQRDPAGRQHRLHAAPDRAARLRDGRPAAAPRRAGLSRVRRRAPPCLVAGVAGARAARPGALLRLQHPRRGRLQRDALACRRLAGLRQRKRRPARGAARAHCARRSACACRCAPASAA